MSIYLRLLLVGAMALLGACQSGAGEEGPEKLSIERIDETLQASECRDDQGCAKIALAYLSFPEAPALSAELERRLFAMLEGVGTTQADIEAPPSLDARAESFFTSAREAQQANPEIPPFDANLKAEVVSDHDDLLVIELAGYVYTGGAHGMPMTEYLVIDQRDRRSLGLGDMLLEGQRDAFDAAVARAHLRWLEEIEQDVEFASQWPLVPTDNVAPMAADVVVKYNAYDIAPYALGQPELHLTYEELDGIFAERYLP